MFKGVPETKIEVAEKVFGVKYHSLWRWETYGVPDRKVAKVDAILCNLERNAFGRIESLDPVVRAKGLMTPEGVKKRLSRLYPGLWKEVKEGENK